PASRAPSGLRRSSLRAAREATMLASSRGSAGASSMTVSNAPVGGGSARASSASSTSRSLIATASLPDRSVLPDREEHPFRDPVLRVVVGHDEAPECTQVARALRAAEEVHHRPEVEEDHIA